MLDLAEGVLFEFSEAQLRAPNKPWGLGPDLHCDNRLARQKSKKALDRLVDEELRCLRALRTTPLRLDFTNVDGSRWCIVCRRTREAESFVVQTGRCAGKTVGTCRCCRKYV
jgi:hypothetical protein